MYALALRRAAERGTRKEESSQTKNQRSSRRKSCRTDYIKKKQRQKIEVVAERGSRRGSNQEGEKTRREFHQTETCGEKRYSKERGTKKNI